MRADVTVSPTSRRRSKARILSGLALVLMLATACPPGETPEARESTARENRSLLEYVPDADYISFGFVDIDSLTAQPWSKDLTSLIPALEVWDKKLGISMDQFHRIALAVEFPKDLSKEPDTLMILSSDLDENQILSLVGDKSHYFEKQVVAGLTRYSSGTEFSFAVLDPGIVVLGSPASVLRAMELRGGKGTKVTAGTHVDRFENYFGEKDNIWFGIGGFDRLIGQLAQENIYLKNYATIEFVYFGMTAGEGLGGRMILECSNEKDAGKLARGISGMIGIMSTLVDFEGFDMQSDEIDIPLDELKKHMESFFSSINVEHQSRNVVITYTVPQEMVDFFLQMSREAMRKHQDKAQLPDEMGADQLPELDEAPIIEQ